jgi:hypothetical protein
MKTIRAVLLAARVILGHEQFKPALLGGGELGLTLERAIKLGIKC